MNLIRTLISVFLFALLLSTIAGWLWAGGQPPTQAIGSRIALVLCAFAAISGFALLWSARPYPTDINVDHSSQDQQ
ncbi:hypothetical protein [Roseiconus lacunae]|uniref:hypothetical protein n=1 Tax=Roseiconus lacunae TaxID=2605694 RepID=UPI0011F0DE1C|nr:hypothetical protein [Roseiconus lacunae]MCD0460087.1 hypothetical protein [Roseiconus lacunae]WRQ50552.1 hypothetical protein U8335_26845 [Stieleria sp. HD01]